MNLKDMKIGQVVTSDAKSEYEKYKKAHPKTKKTLHDFENARDVKKVEKEYRPNLSKEERSPDNSKYIKNAEQVFKDEEWDKGHIKSRKDMEHQVNEFLDSTYGIPTNPKLMTESQKKIKTDIVNHMMKKLNVPKVHTPTPEEIEKYSNMKHYDIPKEMKQVVYDNLARQQKELYNKYGGFEKLAEKGTEAEKEKHKELTEKLNGIRSSIPQSKR